MGKLVGVLVVNGYLRTPKFEEMNGLYSVAAAKVDVEVVIHYTHEIVYGIKQGEPYNSLVACYEQLDFVLFLDKDIHMAKSFEALGIRVFNASHVIEICDNKALTFQKLSGYDVPMPETIIAPLVYEGTYQKQDESYVTMIGETLGFPLVVKESYGSFGEQVYLIHSHQELWEKHQELIYKPHIYQKFITSSVGRDVRINVVGGKVVASMLRTSQNDFRANITNGGKMKVWQCDEAFEALALKVCGLLGADFAGVDLLFGEQGEPLLCEVNSNAHIKNILMCTGVNVAEAIICHIQKECQDD